MLTKVIVMCNEGDLEMLETIRENSSRQTLSQIMNDALQFYYTHRGYTNDSQGVGTPLIKTQE